MRGFIHWNGSKKWTRCCRSSKRARVWHHRARVEGSRLRLSDASDSSGAFFSCHSEASAQRVAEEPRHRNATALLINCHHGERQHRMMRLFAPKVDRAWSQSVWSAHRSTFEVLQRPASRLLQNDKKKSGHFRMTR